MGWRSEPAAYSYWVCEACEASSGVPEAGAEDIGVVGLRTSIALARGDLNGLLVSGWYRGIYIDDGHGRVVPEVLRGIRAVTTIYSIR